MCYHFNRYITKYVQTVCELHANKRHSINNTFCMACALLICLSLCTGSPAGQVYLIKGPHPAFNYRAALFNPAQGTDVSMVTSATVSTRACPRLRISIYFQINCALIIIQSIYLHECLCLCM